MKADKLEEMVSEKISNRDYYGAFQIIDAESERYLSSDLDDYSLCLELMNHNQNLYEYMGSSKQFEMAFEILNKLIRNRNRLFISCIDDNRRELKSVFKRFVGDFSSDY